MLIGVGPDGKIVGQQVAEARSATSQRCSAVSSRPHASRCAVWTWRPAGDRALCAACSAAIAVFDDRIEVRSIGDFPTGVRAELLSREHLSVRHNPLIAEAFHRTGAIETWGGGTNRVIETCRAYCIPDPTFVEESGSVTVTFKAEVVAGADLGRSVSQVGPKCVSSRSA